MAAKGRASSVKLNNARAKRGQPISFSFCVHSHETLVTPSLPMPPPSSGFRSEATGRRHERSEFHRCTVSVGKPVARLGEARNSFNPLKADEEVGLGFLHSRAFASSLWIHVWKKGGGN